MRKRKNDAAAVVERIERIAAGRLRCESALLAGLAKEVGDASLLDGWTVTFDLEGVSGDPEGVQRGPRMNSRHKSIKFIDPEGGCYTRSEALQHLNPKNEDENADEEEAPARSAAPVKEPPPVETDAGLAFEVDRLLDVRMVQPRKKVEPTREYLTRWVGYGPEDDSWEVCGRPPNAREPASGWPYGPALTAGGSIARGAARGELPRPRAHP
jgi:hypothetical protein